MPFLWLTLAGAMVHLYVFLEWKITTNVARGIMGEGKVLLPGKGLDYVIARAVIAFVGISAINLALLTYVGADVQFGCWLGLGLMVSGIVAIGTYARLR